MATGHIRKRAKAKNHWSLVIELDPDPETGKRRQKWITFHGSKVQAEEELRRLLREKDRGLPVDTSKWTVRQYLEHWLATYVLQSVRPKTRAGYASIVAQRIIPIIGSIKLAKLTGVQIREMQAELLTRGRRVPGARPLSPRSVHHTYVVLSEALGQAVKWGLLARNVAEHVDPPRAERHNEMRAWNVEEARRFLFHARANPDDSGYGVACVFALETGVRQGELLGLRWRDVDLAQGTAQIRHTVGRVPKEGLVEGQPKTARGRRRIALNPALIELLTDHRARQATVRIQIGPRWQDRDLVFCTPLGTPIDPTNLYHYFLRLAHQARLPRIRFHDLRHTHATLLLLANVPVKVVSERLGHASIAITLDIYSHVLPDMQADATAKWESLLHPPEAPRLQIVSSVLPIREELGG